MSFFCHTLHLEILIDREHGGDGAKHRSRKDEHEEHEREVAGIIAREIESAEPAGRVYSGIPARRYEKDEHGGRCKHARDDSGHDERALDIEIGGTDEPHNGYLIFGGIDGEPNGRKGYED